MIKKGREKGTIFSRKRKEVSLPKITYKGSSYYIVSPSLILTMKLDGYPVYVKSKIIDKPRITFRKPIPIFGGEHEHAVIFTIEGGITVVFHGVAFLLQGEYTEIYGVVRDKKQIIANTIITDKAEYNVQL